MQSLSPTLPLPSSLSLPSSLPHSLFLSPSSLPHPPASPPLPPYRPFTPSSPSSLSLPPSLSHPLTPSIASFPLIFGTHPLTHLRDQLLQVLVGARRFLDYRQQWEPRLTLAVQRQRIVLLMPTSLHRPAAADSFLTVSYRSK